MTFDDPVDPPAALPSLSAKETAAALVHLDRLEACDDLDTLRERTGQWREELSRPAPGEGSEALAEAPNPPRRDALLADLEQLRAAQTLDRARHYLSRLRKGFTETRTGPLNDLNLARWKECDEVLTDSLWLEERRDRSGAHSAEYWGNFIPQIPRQMMLRYTRRGDWVLDAFAGSGTTLIECRRMGRHGLGLELNPEVTRAAAERIALEPNPYGVTTQIVTADSQTADIRALLAEHGATSVQLALLHPPYHDIIRFSDADADLSTAPSTEAFLGMFGAVVENTAPLLDSGRMMAVVIGDKYAAGEWEPLGFLCMNEAMRRGFRLKSIVVKNFNRTRGKRQQESLWRYRALAGGFYVFKHEYLLVLQKK